MFYAQSTTAVISWRSLSCRWLVILKLECQAQLLLFKYFGPGRPTNNCEPWHLLKTNLDCFGFLSCFSGFSRNSAYWNSVFSSFGIQISVEMQNNFQPCWRHVVTEQIVWFIFILATLQKYVCLHFPYLFCVLWDHQSYWCVRFEFVHRRTYWKNSFWSPTFLVQLWP